MKIIFAQRDSLKVFTASELSRYNGRNGNPAYVALRGKVYDVTAEEAWQGGSHSGLQAGRDLTAEFNGCHSDRPDILINLPQVGVLEG